MNDLMGVLEMISAGYPNAKLSEENIAVYLAGLSDIPPDVLRNAALRLMRRSKWFPTIAELREESLGSEEDRRVRLEYSRYENRKSLPASKVQSESADRRALAGLAEKLSQPFKPVWKPFTKRDVARVCRDHERIVHHWQTSDRCFGCVKGEGW